MESVSTRVESVSTRVESVSTRVESAPGGKCFHPGGKSRDTNRAFKYVKRHYEISRVWDKEKIASQFSIGTFHPGGNTFHPV